MVTNAMNVSLFFIPNSGNIFPLPVLKIAYQVHPSLFEEHSIFYTQQPGSKANNEQQILPVGLDVKCCVAKVAPLLLMVAATLSITEAQAIPAAALLYDLQLAMYRYQLEVQRRKSACNIGYRY